MGGSVAVVPESGIDPAASGEPAVVYSSGPERSGTSLVGRFLCCCTLMERSRVC